jgi:hypothetical protein
MTNREKFIVDLYTAVEVLQNTLMDVGNDLDYSDDPAKAEAEDLLSSVWTEVEKVEEFAIKLDSTNILVECLVQQLEGGE